MDLELRHIQIVRAVADAGSLTRAATAQPALSTQLKRIERALGGTLFLRGATGVRATFPVTPGVVTRPLAGTPLIWRHLLGWHPAARVAARAADVLDHARAAHAEALARSAGAAALRQAAVRPAAPSPAA